MTRPHIRSLITSGVFLLILSANFIAALVVGIRNANPSIIGFQGIWLIPATWWFVHCLRRYRQSTIHPGGPTTSEPIKPRRAFTVGGRVTRNAPAEYDQLMPDLEDPSKQG